MNARDAIVTQIAETNSNCIIKITASESHMISTRSWDRPLTACAVRPGRADRHVVCAAGGCATGASRAAGGGPQTVTPAGC